MGWALRALAERDETEDRLRPLFERTLRDDLTPQERRALAGEIVLTIPVEDDGMMMIQALRAYAERALGLAGPSPALAGFTAVDAKTGKAEELSSAAEEQRAQLVSLGSKGGGRPMLSADKARRNLLSAMTRFRQSHDVTERLTNVVLAKAAGVSADTISNWLACAGWTLDELDVEWARRRTKKPE